MRSKEVSKAIDKLTIAQNNLLEATLYSQEEQDEDIKTVLSYIETLEKQIPTPSNEVPVEYQTLILVDKRDAVMKSEIRDKIKELEEQDELYKGYKGLEFSRTGVINLQIKLLKEIIGE